MYDVEGHGQRDEVWREREARRLESEMSRMTNGHAANVKNGNNHLRAENAFETPRLPVVFVLGRNEISTR